MKKLTPQDIPLLGQPEKIPMIQMTADNIPTYRVAKAIKNKVLNNCMMIARGGLGDVVCTEPAARFAITHFKNFQLSIVTAYPQIFKHLNLRKLFDDSAKDLKIYKPDYFWVTNYPADKAIEWEFFAHPFMNTVDAISISSFRSMIHIDEKDIRLVPDSKGEKLTNIEKLELAALAETHQLVLIHAGVTWKSRTFPTAWWNEVVSECKARGLKPVLIGAKTREGVGVVELDGEGCIDLRDRTSIDDLIWLCQQARVILTNDSSPLHFGASSNPNDPTSGRAWIGYIATCRHPDFITHWRRNQDTGKNEWNWREVNLGNMDGGLWNFSDYYVREGELSLQDYDYDRVLKCLPEPKTMANFAASKVGKP